MSRRGLPDWIHREATRAHAVRQRRRAWATARAVDDVTHTRFAATGPAASGRTGPVLGVAAGGRAPGRDPGLVLLLTGTGAARALGASTLGGVVAAIVVVPVQVVLARRAAQVEFERDGELVQVAVDRVLEEVAGMLDDEAT